MARPLLLCVLLGLCLSPLAGEGFGFTGGLSLDSQGSLELSSRLDFAGLEAFLRGRAGGAASQACGALSIGGEGLNLSFGTLKAGGLLSFALSPLTLSPPSRLAPPLAVDPELRAGFTGLILRGATWSLFCLRPPPPGTPDSEEEDPEGAETPWLVPDFLPSAQGYAGLEGAGGGVEVGLRFGGITGALLLAAGSFPEKAAGSWTDSAPPGPWASTLACLSLGTEGARPRVSLALALSDHELAGLGGAARLETSASSGPWVLAALAAARSTDFRGWKGREAGDLARAYLDLSLRALPLLSLSFRKGLEAIQAPPRGDPRLLRGSRLRLDLGDPGGGGPRAALSFETETDPEVVEVAILACLGADPGPLSLRAEAGSEFRGSCAGEKTEVGRLLKALADPISLELSLGLEAGVSLPRLFGQVLRLETRIATSLGLGPAGSGWEAGLEPTRLGFSAGLALASGRAWALDLGLGGEEPWTGGGTKPLSLLAQEGMLKFTWRR